MGGSKQSTVSETKVTATPEETELNKMRLDQQRAIQPQSIDIQKNAYSLGNLLLQGQDLPGYLQQVPYGVESQQIPLESTQLGEDYTADLVRQSLRDIMPQFQKMGLPIESGVAQSISGRTAGDIRRGVAEGNIGRGLAAREANINTEMTSRYQNLNNLFNLLNLAVGGQAQIQAPVISTGGQLSSALAGLRSTSTTSQTKSQASFADSFSKIAGGLGSMTGGCWVAKEIFGSWEHPKVIMSRFYINNYAPKWFKNFYFKYGEKIAKFIHNKPVLKYMLKPLFELFVYKSRRLLWL